MLLALPIAPQSFEVHGDGLVVQDCHSHHSANDEIANDNVSKDNSTEDEHSCHDTCHMACCHITLSITQSNHFRTPSISKNLIVQFLFKIGPPKNISFKLFRPPILTA